MKSLLPELLSVPCTSQTLWEASDFKLLRGIHLLVKSFSNSVTPKVSFLSCALQGACALSHTPPSKGEPGTPTQRPSLPLSALLSARLPCPQPPAVCGIPALCCLQDEPGLCRCLCPFLRHRPTLLLMSGLTHYRAAGEILTLPRLHLDPDLNGEDETRA